MTPQPLAALQGEIAFREKLYRQQVEGESIFADEFDAAGIEAILKSRMKQTLAHMKTLQKRHIPLSPYLEIGAERGQRSLILENHLKAHGAALDLSFHMLKSNTHYRQIFALPQQPLRICCDISELPLATGSIPFIFCYQTLHHFPDPLPIFQEIHRVLSPGGFFFFAEEPFQKRWHLPLYQGSKIYAPQSLKAPKLKKLLDYFFAHDHCNETEYGIVENDEITLTTWKKGIQLFDSHEANLKSMNRLSATWLPEPSSLFPLVSRLGGELTALCRKSPKHTGYPSAHIQEALICPHCQQSRLQKNQCPTCQIPYPIVDDILVLLSPEKRKLLYPEFVSLR